MWWLNELPWVFFRPCCVGLSLLTADTPNSDELDNEHFAGPVGMGVARDGEGWCQTSLLGGGGWWGSADIPVSIALGPTPVSAVLVSKAAGGCCDLGESNEGRMCGMPGVGGWGIDSCAVTGKGGSNKLGAERCSGSFPFTCFFWNLLFTYLLIYELMP